MWHGPVIRFLRVCVILQHVTWACYQVFTCLCDITTRDMGLLSGFYLSVWYYNMWHGPVIRFLPICVILQHVTWACYQVFTCLCDITTRDMGLLSGFYLSVWYYNMWHGPVIRFLPVCVILQHVTWACYQVFTCLCDITTRDMGLLSGFYLSVWYYNTWHGPVIRFLPVCVILQHVTWACYQVFTCLCDITTCDMGLLSGFYLSVWYYNMWHVPVIRFLPVCVILQHVTWASYQVFTCMCDITTCDMGLLSGFYLSVWYYMWHGPVIRFLPVCVILQHVTWACYQVFTCLCDITTCDMGLLLGFYLSVWYYNMWHGPVIRFSQVCVLLQHVTWACHQVFTCMCDITTRDMCILSGFYLSVWYYNMWHGPVIKFLPVCVILQHVTWACYQVFTCMCDITTCDMGLLLSFYLSVWYYNMWHGPVIRFLPVCVILQHVTWACYHVFTYLCDITTRDMGLLSGFYMYVWYYNMWHGPVIRFVPVCVILQHVTWACYQVFTCLCDITTCDMGLLSCFYLSVWYYNTWHGPVIRFLHVCVILQHVTWACYQIFTCLCDITTCDMGLLSGFYLSVWYYNMWHVPVIRFLRVCVILRHVTWACYQVFTCLCDITTCDMGLLSGFYLSVWYYNMWHVPVIRFLRVCVILRHVTWACYQVFTCLCDITTCDMGLLSGFYLSVWYYNTWHGPVIRCLPVCVILQHVTWACYQVFTCLCDITTCDMGLLSGFYLSVWYYNMWHGPVIRFLPVCVILQHVTWACYQVFSCLCDITTRDMGLLSGFYLSVWYYNTWPVPVIRFLPVCVILQHVTCACYQVFTCLCDITTRDMGLLSGFYLSVWYYNMWHGPVIRFLPVCVILQHVTWACYQVFTCLCDITTCDMGLLSGFYLSVWYYNMWHGPVIRFLPVCVILQHVTWACYQVFTCLCDITTCDMGLLSGFYLSVWYYNMWHGPVIRFLPVCVILQHVTWACYQVFTCLCDITTCDMGLLSGFYLSVWYYNTWHGPVIRFLPVCVILQHVTCACYQVFTCLCDITTCDMGLLSGFFLSVWYYNTWHGPVIRFLPVCVILQHVTCACYQVFTCLCDITTCDLCLLSGFYLSVWYYNMWHGPVIRFLPVCVILQHVTWACYQVFTCLCDITTRDMGLLSGFHRSVCYYNMWHGPVIRFLRVCVILQHVTCAYYQVFTCLCDITTYDMGLLSGFYLFVWYYNI